MYYLLYGLRQLILFLSTGIYQHVSKGYEARLLGSYGPRLLFRLVTGEPGSEPTRKPHAEGNNTIAITSATNILTDGFETKAIKQQLS